MKKELDYISSLPVTENYTPRDKYQDFHQLFSTDQGQRVLREILSWGRMFSTPITGSPVDPYLSHVRIGEANIAIKLLSVISNEPPEQPTKVKRSK